MNIAVYPGSFDPLTNGHLDVIERSAAVFDKVIVGVLTNMSKVPVFDTDERMDMIKSATKHLDNIEVCSFSGLLVDLMSEVGANVIIKGVRTVTDFEYEFQMALLNKSLNPSVETFFIMTDSKYSYISSSMVKEVARLGGNVGELVPHGVEKKLSEKYGIGRQK